MEYRLSAYEKQRMFYTAAILLFVIAFLSLCLVANHYQTKKFVDGWYSEVLLPGKSYTAWQKVCR